MGTILQSLLLGLLSCLQTQAANTTGNGTNTELLQCAKSWSSYDAASSADVTYVPTTSTYYEEWTVDMLSGTADVYTTIEGIPVASGVFTPTSTVEKVYNVTSTYVDWEETTINPSIIANTPACTPPSPSDCSMLYVTYLSSLGLPSNASVPSITPVPTNSPACSEYYYKPFSTCTTFLDSGGGLGTCSVYATNAQLFYFPTKTADATATGPDALITPTVVKSMAPGVTFTSPSVYLSFDSLRAISWVAVNEWACSSCGWNGCAASAVGGGDGLAFIGTATTGALLGLAPTDVSSILVGFPDAQATDVVNVLAHGLPGFANDIAEVIYAGSPTTRALDVRALAHPAPTDYYLKPGAPPGCDSSFPVPECSTIFEGLYTPILSMPSQVTLLQSAWSSCVPADYGVTAMPTALTDVTTIGGAAQYSSPTTSAEPQSTDTCLEVQVSSSVA